MIMIGAAFTMAAVLFLAVGYFLLLLSAFSTARAALLLPLLMGSATWVSTEVLSAFSLLRSGAMWTVLVVAFVPLIAWHKRVRQGASAYVTTMRRTRPAVSADFRSLGLWRWPVGASLIVATMVLGVTLFLALWGPPNNADSLGYHLPRVMQWLQNANVNHFATADLRMVSIPPLAGYGLAWLMGLSGSDLLLNGMQWVAYAWSALLAGLMTRRISGHWMTGLIAIALVACMPMGLAEATTTQNDWISALWAVVALGLIIERLAGKLPLRVYAPALAACAGLAAATKATGLLAVGVLVGVAIVAEITTTKLAVRSRAGAAGLIGLGGLVGAAVGLVPQSLRNLATFDSPIGDTLGVVTERHDMVTLTGNTLRILINNVGVPRSIGDMVNPQLPKLLETLHIPWVDSAAVGYSHLPSISLARNEDYATSPVQLILGLAAAVLVLVLPRMPRAVRIVGVSGIAMLLASALAWKWNQWSNRFLLQVMVALCVPLAFVIWRGLSASGKRRHLSRATAALLLLATSVYGLLVSLTLQYRPIIDADSVLFMPRVDRYFYVTGPGDRSSLADAGRVIRETPSGSVIGLQATEGTNAYPIWALYNPDFRVRLEAIDTGNVTSKYEIPRVDKVICLSGCPSIVE